MARDATLTRARLIRAGERRFARDGVRGARVADIVRDAGQGNDSAVGYHFGSRQGLLHAIVERHVAQMDRSRVLPPPGSGLRPLVEAIVLPTAALLVTEEGRDFLRIMEQVSDWSGLGAGRPNPVLEGTVLAAQLEALDSLLVARVGRVLARERAALLVTFLTASLAERARSRANGARQRLGHEKFTDHLVDLLTAALAA
ncbi:TetR/AcrR family transcriptional regulator [Nocardioides pocheonensis]|uniref:TetR/AcrR family transcriptional regulator n=1 Tax=Nocardioides pocheonensis TaxID=661485 RepID=A0A3N0GJY4_9ACTN|nr:TetR/AcrR family transcriptional regulator [Nocardioides pocheonensis]RNM12775.1 TetR/AcrR family transcriptional regulator [Nocardioides pocheonensis]